MKSGAAFYCVRHRILVLKLVGAVRMASRESFRLSAALEAFIHGLPERSDFDDILIDLSEASSMDSTHLGLLAQVSQFTRSSGKEPPTILTPNDDITLLLESVGFDQVFLLVRTAARAAREDSLTCLPGVEPSQSEHVRLLLEAHRALIAVHDANREHFENVVELFEQELRKTPPHPSDT